MDKSQVLRTVKDIDVKGKKVLVRLDLDVPLVEVRGQGSGVRIADDTRLVNTLATIKYLLDKQAKVTIIGHLGKPHGKAVEKLKVEPVRKWFETKFPGAPIKVEENLRFDMGEETNLQSFAEYIVRRSSAEVFVFEAFATAHEPHASVVSVPKLVAETAVGFRFAEEIRNLFKIWQKPKRPVVFVLGGAKLSTKLPLIEKLSEAGDEVLLGGLFPSQVQSSRLRLPFASGFYPNTAHGALFGGQAKLKAQSYSSKLRVAMLRGDGLDITEESARMFADRIMAAGTVVWNGPMGAFEKSSHKSEIINHKSESQYINTPTYGTYIVAKAMRETGAFTVAGGGDTEAALTKLGGSEGIDWISSGGGAMLYFLAYHTLPFLEALPK